MRGVQSKSNTYSKKRPVYTGNGQNKLEKMHEGLCYT